jgi:hypothetical protein
MARVPILLSALALITFSNRPAAARGVPAKLLTPQTRAAARSWETSLEPTEEIRDQGDTAYCLLYAMSSFLELWGDTEPGALRRLPSLSPAYLALAYNYEAGNGTLGTVPEWLRAIVEKHGVIPKSAEPADEEVPWPVTDWQARHRHLIPMDFLKPVLEARYLSDSEPLPFTGKEYLQRNVGTGLASLRFVQSSYSEGETLEDDEPSEVEYRKGSQALASRHVDSIAREQGVDARVSSVAPDELYKRSKRQLYDGRPVLWSIDVGLTKARFRYYQVVGGGDLVEPGEGIPDYHSVVAVAHCDQWESDDPICARFTRRMASRGIDECIVIQNSWGESANARGYACLSRKALRRLLLDAFLEP